MLGPGESGPGDSRVRLPGSLLACLLCALAWSSCIGSPLHEGSRRPGARPSYQPPQHISGSAIFAKGQLPAVQEVQRLANARTAASLLRRAWLELQIERPQAALDSAGTVLFAATPPNAPTEAFARFLRSEAYLQKGDRDRSDYDRGRARALALDPELQRRLRAPTAPIPSHKPWGRLAVTERSAWQPTKVNLSNLDAMQTPRRVTIHHSAMYFRDTRTRAAAAQIARIQREHMHNRQYGDIGYHFLIDPSGRIWEGRELRYQGAHASGSNNIGNVGICLLGNFVRERSGQGPTRSQIRSMEQLVVQLMQHYRFDGSALFCHSDFKATQCPGPRMAPLVKQFARRLKMAGSRVAITDEE